MSWSAALLALLVSHAVGDVMLQTDWQATTKTAGLLDPLGRRALASHVAIYMLAFIPALVWIGLETNAPRAIAVGAIVAVLHLLVDDGWVVDFWLRRVKRTTAPALALRIAVDQAFHVVTLLIAALVAAA